MMNGQLTRHGPNTLAKKKKTVDQRLQEELFPITHAEWEGNQLEVVKRKKVESSVKDIDDDYKYARENLYNLIERGNDALEGILDLAKEMEHPRAYEVASGLIKNISETTTELLKMQKELKALRDSEEKTETTTNNHLYVGSTTELQKLLSGKDNTDG